MYRALTWVALREGVSLADGPALAAPAHGHPISVWPDGAVHEPQAEVKVFLVAGDSVRARRPTAERPGETPESLAADLRARDERDAVNTQPAADAVLLDTTDLTVDDVVARIADLVAERR